MKLPIYQIDAFAEKAFEGNPAAVCPLKEWLPDSVMQSIAEENNLSETAFFVKTQQGFDIRWFTPVAEVDLCGHATLASAYVIFNILEHKEEEIVFNSKSGELKVSRDEELLVMDFPSQEPVECEVPEAIKQAFNSQPIECLKSDDYIVVFGSEDEVSSAKPDIQKLNMLDLRGVIITSTSDRFDFVSRFFAPKYGISEDPVTGSAYTQLVPYWSAVLGRNKHHVKQLSKRGGELFCELAGNRVFIAGKAVQYMAGEIEI
ncbi:PhzF family phenazine biosynthesis protein [Thiomicrorhabdus sp. ZW0627]|uniref:PhzF family phenazine biosynthesis protein n=1 Tax=Thiomicrorhabdus sp. ZW0627 TaxID=3039774 RepID=UPI0024367385|nr:PhzF family phenazine biosynthesis protein [Thiomicrorhabdus sp. ZW0627]MDG6774599.1 PhzF family phenazine biosynthesis protein [Thiomicrorhabdus sp. ZW0627]